MRLATWNIEWFSYLFDDNNQPADDDRPSGRNGVTRRAQLLAIGRVLAAMNADAIFIVEAPDQGRRRSCTAALEAFAARTGLRTRAAIMGFPSETEQELALLYDPDVLGVTHDPRESRRAPRFNTQARVGLGRDHPPEIARFARAPLEMAITPAHGTPFRMIGVHAKSKAPYGARSEDEAQRIAEVNRRKLLAQCLWLRHRVEDHLRGGDDLVVLGDLNDGPGLDDFEGLFGLSGVEVVMGCDYAQGCELPDALRLYDPHAVAALRRPLGGGPSTARFYDRRTERYFPALLDYILISESLRQRHPRWRIWHPFDDPACWADEGLRQALLDASDHFPVTLDLSP